jgi:hypothetical protein
MAKYRKRHTYECMQWGPGEEAEVNDLVGGTRFSVSGVSDEGVLSLTCEGDGVPVEPGDWLVKDAFGGVYAIKPDQFAANFEVCRSRSRG